MSTAISHEPVQREFEFMFGHNAKARELRLARSRDLANKLQRNLPELADVQVDFDLACGDLDRLGIDGKIAVYGPGHNAILPLVFVQVKEPRQVDGFEDDQVLQGWAFTGLHTGRPIVSDATAPVSEPVNPEVFLLLQPTRRGNKLALDDVGVCLIDDIEVRKSGAHGLAEDNGYVLCSRCAKLSHLVEAVRGMKRPSTWRTILRRVLADKGAWWSTAKERRSG